MTIAEAEGAIDVDPLRPDVALIRHVAKSDPDGGVGYRQQPILQFPGLISSREPPAVQLHHIMGLVGGSANAQREREGVPRAPRGRCSYPDRPVRAASLGMDRRPSVAVP